MVVKITEEQKPESENDRVWEILYAFLRKNDFSMHIIDTISRKTLGAFGTEKSLFEVVFDDSIPHVQPKYENHKAGYYYSPKAQIGIFNRQPELEVRMSYKSVEVHPARLTRPPLLGVYFYMVLKYEKESSNLG